MRAGSPRSVQNHHFAMIGSEPVERGGGPGESDPGQTLIGVDFGLPPAEKRIGLAGGRHRLANERHAVAEVHAFTSPVTMRTVD